MHLSRYQPTNAASVARTLGAHVWTSLAYMTIYSPINGTIALFDIYSACGLRDWSPGPLYIVRDLGNRYFVGVFGILLISYMWILASSEMDTHETSAILVYFGYLIFEIPLYFWASMIFGWGFGLIYPLGGEIEIKRRPREENGSESFLTSEMRIVKITLIPFSACLATALLVTIAAVAQPVHAAGGGQTKFQRISDTVHRGVG